MATGPPNPPDGDRDPDQGDDAVKKIVNFIFLALAGIMIAGIPLGMTGITPEGFGVLCLFGLFLISPIYFTFFTDTGGKGPYSSGSVDLKKV